MNVVWETSFFENFEENLSWVLFSRWLAVLTFRFSPSHFVKVNSEVEECDQLLLSFSTKGLEGTKAFFSCLAMSLLDQWRTQPSWTLSLFFHYSPRALLSISVPDLCEKPTFIKREYFSLEKGHNEGPPKLTKLNELRPVSHPALLSSSKGTTRQPAILPHLPYRVCSLFFRPRDEED